MDLNFWLDQLAEDAIGHSTEPRFSNWIAKELDGALALLDFNGIEPLVDVAREVSALTIESVLDFGCGDGSSRDMFSRKQIPHWTGLDYSASIDPTALRRVALGNTGNVILYDGEAFPINGASFDLVWSMQSLEHVHSAEVAIGEIARVLRRGGVLAGSVSFLEGFHAHSTFGYSPYGFMLLCRRAGLKLERLYPRNDGLALIGRAACSVAGAPESYSKWGPLMEGGGPFFRALRRLAKTRGLSDALLAEAQAQFCGQFFFVAVRD